MQSILEQYAKSLSFDSSKWNFRKSKRDNDEIFDDLDHLHVMLVSYWYKIFIFHLIKNTCKTMCANPKPNERNVP